MKNNNTERIIFLMYDNELELLENVLFLDAFVII